MESVWVIVTELPGLIADPLLAGKLIDGLLLVTATTVTVNVAVEIDVPLLTCRIKLTTPADAVVLAVISAVIVPLVLTILESFIPTAGLALVTVTLRVFIGTFRSLTEAMIELEPYIPIILVIPLAATMVGAEREKM